VAFDAQRSHVREVAFATAFHHRHDMVRIPQVATAAPILFELAARPVIQLALIAAHRLSIETALRAHTGIAREYLFAQVSGIGAQPPFMYAGIGAKRESALGDSDPAPAA
jgi:hypothetical protein